MLKEFGLTGDERIELPPKVLETPIIPFDQSPVLKCTFKTTHIVSDFSRFSVMSLLRSQTFRLFSVLILRFWSSFRPISSSQLHASLHFHLCPIYLIVSKGSLMFPPGDLILRGASRLDAFSVYPDPSWLPSRAIGMTTGPPADGPSRSSRTKDSSSQISHARAG